MSDGIIIKSRDVGIMCSLFNLYFVRDRERLILADVLKKPESEDAFAKRALRIVDNYDQNSKQSRLGETG